MSDRRYDVAVIGAGPGGYVAAIRAAQLGLRTVCIDKSKNLGGTCLNVGCIPSKALLSSSEKYEWLTHSATIHGISVTKAAFDFSSMQKRKEEIVQSHVLGIGSLFKKNRIETITGMASFASQNRLLVKTDDENLEIEASNFIIATGSEPINLPFLPFDETKIISSTGALALKEVPKKMIVIGAGAIGLELASVYQRLGTQVAVIEMLEMISPLMDKAISKTLLQILKKQGMEFYLGAKVTSGEITTKGLQVKFEQSEKKQDLEGDLLLVAVGRAPNVKGLGLENCGISTTGKGTIAVDGEFRTSASNIFAIGDVIEGPMLAHRASEEGIAVAEIISGKKPHINYMCIPNIIYTHPEAASVGMTEDEAQQAKIQIKSGMCNFKANSRARCIDEVDGFVKVIAEANGGRIIGMHILGSNASEIIGEGVVAIENKMTLEELASTCHAHPTLSEAIKEATLNALGRAIHF